MKKTTLRKLLTGLTISATMAVSLSTGFVSNAEEDFDYNSYEDLESDTYEYVDPKSACYFKDQYGNIWEFFKVYDVNQGEEFDDFVVEHGNAKGVVCRLYTGEEDPFYVLPYDEDFFSAHNTEGTFTYNGVEYQYDITPNAEMDVNIRWALYRKILGYVLPDDDETTLYLIKHYDYKKDGQINIADVVLFNKYFMSTPFRFCAHYDEKEGELKCMSPEDFYKILDWHYMDLMEDQCTIRFGDTIPTGNATVDSNTGFLVEGTAAEMVLNAKANGLNQIAFVTG